MSVMLSAYDPDWPAQFKTLAGPIHQALGAGTEVQHIGSTSVPGLLAKPIIDMQLGVKDLDAFDPASLRGAGFEFETRITTDEPPFWDDPSPPEWRKAYFRATRDGDRAAHLHVRQKGKRNHALALRFRDYLRAHPDVATAYARMKSVAAQTGGQGSNTGGSGAYLDLKTPFVELVLLHADRWARG